jgi:hypothetical protein
MRWEERLSHSSLIAINYLKKHLLVRQEKSYMYAYFNLFILKKTKCSVFEENKILKVWFFEKGILDSCTQMSNRPFPL